VILSYFKMEIKCFQFITRTEKRKAMRDRNIPIQWLPISAENSAILTKVPSNFHQTVLENVEIAQ
jgi:hypothetical protein